MPTVPESVVQVKGSGDNCPFVVSATVRSGKARVGRGRVEGKEGMGGRGDSCCAGKAVIFNVCDNVCCVMFDVLRPL